MSEYVMKRFAEVDALILDALSGRSRYFSDLRYDKRIKAAAASVAKPWPNGYKATERVIDRRLQALKKAGKIVFNSKSGWSKP